MCLCEDLTHPAGTHHPNHTHVFSSFVHFRFIQMAPLYFFYNLPPSEGKEILQGMLDPDRSKKCKENKTKQKGGESGCAVVAPQTYDRCVIQ